jgi:thioredoxin 1
MEVSFYREVIMNHTQPLQTIDYPTKVQQATLPVILDFGAEWCAPCKRLSPILDSLATEWTNKVIIYSVDADANGELVMQFRVMSLPTLVLVKDGKEVSRTIGLQNREKLVEAFAPHI